MPNVDRRHSGDSRCSMRGACKCLGCSRTYVSNNSRKTSPYDRQAWRSSVKIGISTRSQGRGGICLVVTLSIFTTLPREKVRRIQTAHPLGILNTEMWSPWSLVSVSNLRTSVGFSRSRKIDYWHSSSGLLTLAVTHSDPILSDLLRGSSPNKTLTTAMPSDLVMASEDYSG